MLLARDPRRPKPDGGLGVVVGGRMEAWLYRESSRALWAADGALERLRGACSGLRRK